MIGVEVRNNLYIITLPKYRLVLTKDQFIQALRQGKWWRRREALRARQAPPAGWRAGPPAIHHTVREEEGNGHRTQSG